MAEIQGKSILVRISEGKIIVDVWRKSRGNRFWFELARVRVFRSRHCSFLNHCALVFSFCLEYFNRKRSYFLFSIISQYSHLSLIWCFDIFELCVKLRSLAFQRKNCRTGENYWVRPTGWTCFIKWYDERDGWMIGVNIWKYLGFVDKIIQMFWY